MSREGQFKGCGKMRSKFHSVLVSHRLSFIVFVLVSLVCWMTYLFVDGRHWFLNRIWSDGVSRVDVFVDRPFRLVNAVPSDSEIEIDYLLINQSAMPVSLLGSSSSCTCIQVKGVPAVIGPLQSHSVTAVVRADIEDFGAKRLINLFTDHPEFSEIKLGYTLSSAGDSPVEGSSDGIAGLEREPSQVSQ